MIAWETYRLQDCENVGRMHFTPPLIYSHLLTQQLHACRPHRKFVGRFGVSACNGKMSTFRNVVLQKNIRAKTMSINYFTNNYNPEKEKYKI